MRDVNELLALREGTTPGPWGWFGNASYRPSVYLATRHSGRRYVMDFVRWGMQGAQPRFQPARFGMVDAKDLIQFEVGDQSVRGIDAAKADTSVYRLDVRGIDAPDARLIAAAPELLDALDAQAREIAALNGMIQGAAAGTDERSKRWTAFAAHTVDTVQKLGAEIAALTARAEAAEALLKATLDRESETHRRHDAKLEGLETMVRERDYAMALFHITEKTLKAKVDMLQGRLERISTEGSYTSKVLADEVLAEITK